jgi:hypothetical protein
MCNSSYPLVPLTIKTVERCNSACNGTSGIQDDVCCLNCIFWPLTFVLDIVFCPCFYGYYKYTKHQENNQPNHNEKESKIKTTQPVPQ